ncbi:SGNH/GDSL hydrolase family protein [Algoriphagus sanaruensis]|uniref:Lysophospholipase n=1 Tax=Algoriphagus sanaruensis TaxID=1727163 RepID=A0A142ENL6_9BACT|nr:SGNH/GDSL hydrolase family protein [Algoriphagus sanaruensis]AMQ56721.1 lysophospholipase [Algoriphagus sanaruensis]
MSISLISFISSLFLVTLCNPEEPMELKTINYLALGDSYTIGEGVEEKDRYPNQLVDKMNTSGNLFFYPATIIAKTGWTVDELDAGINARQPSEKGYDLVTLLIGVNNQYRGRPVEEYEKDFEAMLNRAIGFARGKNDRVIVLSIPDWAVTGFAKARNTDQKKVGAEIDAYNAAKKAICAKHQVTFIDITEEYRIIGGQPEMMASDRLHPSGLVYEKWTNELVKAVKEIQF